MIFKSPIIFRLVFPGEVSSMVYTFTEVNHCELTVIPVHIENPWTHEHRYRIVLSLTGVGDNVLQKHRVGLLSY